MSAFRVALTRSGIAIVLEMLGPATPRPGQRSGTSHRAQSAGHPALSPGSLSDGIPAAKKVLAIVEEGARVRAPRCHREPIWVGQDSTAACGTGLHLLSASNAD